MKAHQGAMVVLAGLALLNVAARAADFKVEMATYLGGPCVNEEWCAVDIAPDGMVVVAGTMPEGGLGEVKPVDLMGGGYGVVFRLDPKEMKIVSVARLGDYLDDMEVREDGAIAVAGSFGVALLAPDGSKVLWRDGTTVRGSKSAQFRNQTPPFKVERYTKRVSRVAVGNDGVVASIQNDEKAHSGAMKGHLYIWNAAGQRTADVPLVKYKYPKDVCVSAKHQLVIVGGFNTYAADSPHMKNHPIHMPWLVAYTYDGRPKWESYNFSAEASYAQNTYADSRVQRLAIGRDGFLYMGGYIHGGDHVWKHDPHDVKQRVKIDVGYDTCSSAGNMGRGIDHGYFAKFDPATGRPLLGQVLLVRQQPNGGGKPAQLQIKGIHADEQGQVFLSGYCEKYIKDRDRQTINGTPVGEYYKPEPFVMVASPDFRQRKVWTVFSKRCEAASWGISVRNGWAALVAELYEGELITAENALQKTPPGPHDGYLVVWKTGAEK